MTRPALLAVSHGSRDPRARDVVERLVTRVAARRPDLAVRVAYLDHCTPSVDDAVERLAADGVDAVVAVPLLLTAAYHTRVDVPAVLRRAAAATGIRRWAQAAPLGPDRRLLVTAEQRLEEVGVAIGDADTAVVLGAAGSSDPRALATLDGVAAQWQRRGWQAVLPAYASASGPTVREAVHRLRGDGARRVVVASYVLAPGRLPDRLLRGAAEAPADAVSAPLGDSPALADVVLDRYATACARLVTEEALPVAS